MHRILLPLVALVLAVLAYSGYWLYFAHRLGEQVGPWAEARRGEGYDLRWQKATVEGYPLAFRLRFAGATLAARRPYSYALSAPEFQIAAAPWDLSDWRFTAPGGARLDLPASAMAVEAASLDGTVSSESPGQSVVTLRAHDLAGQGLAQGLAIETAAAQFALPSRAPASHLDTMLSLAVDFDKLTLPVAVPSFGPTIDTLSLTGQLKGSLPPGPLAAALAAWRDGGGTLEIESARLVWGKMSASLSGTLALDEALQPMGAMSATIASPEMVIDAAVASGNLRHRFAGLAKAALGIIAKPGADGQSAVSLPVTVQNDQLFLGPAPVARLPHIVWE
jgi:hypothetical protein